MSEFLYIKCQEGNKMAIFMGFENTPLLWNMCMYVAVNLYSAIPRGWLLNP